jgi:hypothetical protein
MMTTGAPLLPAAMRFIDGHCQLHAPDLLLSACKHCEGAGSGTGGRASAA